MHVEFIWQHGCPNVSAARRNLMSAFSVAGLPARWSERCLDDADCPPHARAYGSPTILVDGVDVDGLPAGNGQSCRLYRTENGALVGVPGTEVIAQTLMSPETIRADDGPRFSWKRLGATAPALALAPLPKIACPACWPAYAGVLSSFGVSFLIDAKYLFALTSGFLAIALLFLGFRASRRRGYGPLALGLTSSALLLIGKFYLENDAAMYVGVGLLMSASLWNSWPRTMVAPQKHSASDPSPFAPCCDTATTQTQTLTVRSESGQQGETQ